MLNINASIGKVMRALSDRDWSALYDARPVGITIDDYARDIVTRLKSDEIFDIVTESHHVWGLALAPEDYISKRLFSVNQDRKAAEHATATKISKISTEIKAGIKNLSEALESSVSEFDPDIDTVFINSDDDSDDPMGCGPNCSMCSGGQEEVLGLHPAYFLDDNCDAPEPLLLKTKCAHSWKLYQGFSESYNYCTKCDEKKK